MDSEKYSNLLLDSSFKEANLFWIRNGAFSLFQTLLIGIFISNISDSTKQAPFIILLILTIFGIFIGIIHFLILCISKHYNRTWFNTLKSFVKSKNDKDKNDEINIWQNFHNHLANHDKIKLPDAAFLAIFIPLSLMIIWIIFLILLSTI